VSPEAPRRRKGLGRTSPAESMPWLRLLSWVSALSLGVGMESLGRRLRATSVRILVTKVVGHDQARRYLATVDGLDRNQLLHLVACRTCRRRARSELAAEIAERVMPPPLAKPPTRLDAADLELARRLLTLAPDQRSRAIEADGTWSAPGVGLALLATAACCLDDAGRAEELAELALETMVVPRQPSSKDELERRADAFCLLVLARRRLGRLEQAEATYHQAGEELAGLPALSRQHASLLAALAQLRGTQARVDEAVALFASAAWNFARVGEPQSEAVCRLQLGLAALQQDNPARARAELELGTVAFDPALAPPLALHAAYALAYCHAMLGQITRARRRLRAAAAIARPAAGAGELTACRWWEGRIALHTGRYRQAEAVLDAVRNHLLTDGSLGEAASCTVDLIRTKVIAGKQGGLRGLAGELIDAFGPSLAAVRCARAIESLAEAASDHSGRFDAAAASTRRTVAALAADEARPNLIPAVQPLADRVLVLPLAESTSLGSEPSARREPSGPSAGTRSSKQPARPEAG
jgi:tetratricopeptide (TPR) repeat protein